MQSPRKLDDDDDESLPAKKDDKKDGGDDAGWKLRSRLVRDEPAGIFADGVSRFVVVKWMFLTVVLEVIFYFWLLQYSRANVSMDISVPIIIFAMVVVILFNLFAGIGAWRRQPRRLRYGLISTTAALLILSIPTYVLVNLQKCNHEACLIQDYPVDGNAEPGAPHTAENWKQCEMLGKLKRHFGLTHILLSDGPYAFNIHPTEKKDTVSGSNALRAGKIPGTGLVYRKARDVKLMPIAPVPKYYKTCKDVEENEIFVGGAPDWRSIWCPESVEGSALAEEELPAPPEGEPPSRSVEDPKPAFASFAETKSAHVADASSRGRQTEHVSPRRGAIVREHRQPTNVTAVADEVASVANDTRRVTSELNAVVAREAEIRDRVEQLKGKDGQAQADDLSTVKQLHQNVRERLANKGVLTDSNATAAITANASERPPLPSVMTDEMCRCSLPDGCHMALGGEGEEHERDRFWCKLEQKAAEACLERFMKRRNDPAASEDVAGSPAWPIYIASEQRSHMDQANTSMHKFFWTYGLCEQIRKPDWEQLPGTEAERKKKMPLVSYKEDMVQKRECGCMAPPHEKWCSEQPWEKDLGVRRVDYFFGYTEGCQVAEDEACYFKAKAKSPTTQESAFFSFEPCAEWKDGSNYTVLEQLVMFCQFYKLITVVGFGICAVVHLYAIIAGFIFLRNSCADPVGTTFTSFDNWADEKLDYDGDAWSDPWTDSDDDLQK